MLVLLAFKIHQKMLQDMLMTFASRYEGQWSMLVLPWLPDSLLLWIEFILHENSIHPIRKSSTGILDSKKLNVFQNSVQFVMCSLSLKSRISQKMHIHGSSTVQFCLISFQLKVLVSNCMWKMLYSRHWKECFTSCSCLRETVQGFLITCRGVNSMALPRGDNGTLISMARK